MFEFLRHVGLDHVLAKSGPSAPFTLFGPTNAAFRKLPDLIVEALAGNRTLMKVLLLYHILPGGIYSSQLTNDGQVKSLYRLNPIRINIYQNGKVVTAQGCPIARADMNGTNGVIHVVDKVLLPPMGNVMDVIGNLQDFSIFKRAIHAAQLQNVFNDSGPFTVFAPTNKAFDKLPCGTVRRLLKNKKKLEYVLENHVVEGTYYSAGLNNGTTLDTFSREMLTFTIDGDKVTLKTETDSAKVIVPDVSILNGVIHVIDTVLMPPLML